MGKNPGGLLEQKAVRLCAKNSGPSGEKKELVVNDGGVHQFQAKNFQKGHAIGRREGEFRRILPMSCW